MAEGIAAPVVVAPVVTPAAKPVVPVSAHERANVPVVAHQRGGTAPESKESKAPAPAPAAEPKAEELFEITVKGKKLSLTKDQLIMRAQKGEAAEQRMREAADKDKTLTEIMEAIDRDFEGSMKRLGKDPAKLIEAELARRAKNHLLTPEQQKQAELEAELAKYKDAEAKTVKEKAAEAEKAIKERTYQKVEADLIAAADRHKLPSNADTGLLMLDVAIEFEEYGIHLTPDQVAQEVVHRQQEHLKERDEKLMKNMTPAQLREYLGEDRVKALMAESLKQIPSASRPKAPAPAAQDPIPEEPMNEQEFRDRMKKRGFKLG